MSSQELPRYERRTRLDDPTRQRFYSMDLRSNPDSTIRDMRRYLIEKLYFEMHDLGEKNLKLRSGDMEAFTAAYDSGCVDDYMDKLDLYELLSMEEWHSEYVEKKKKEKSSTHSLFNYVQWLLTAAIFFQSGKCIE